MSGGLLNSAAVARRSNEEAGTILGAYINTNPTMALNHTAEPAAAAAPKGTGGAVDPTRG
jgi:hypothetical protein